MVLHQRQPLKIVFVIGNMIQKVNRFAFEDSQDAFFLFTPGVRIDAIRHQVTRHRAEQRQRRIALSAKRPVVIRRIGCQRKIFLPGFQSDNVIRLYFSRLIQVPPLVGFGQEGGVLFRND